ncbi:DNA methyltransferase [Fibrobacter succinogenes]|uniref:DNA methyltransferase n=1 Tax=Fibrobacter succinogenes TaxID=833 RepID=UPI0026E9A7AD|nr:DNA methyltransferase [Fibrobacter succinogenes]
MVNTQKKMNEKEKKAAAKAFAERWTDKGYEKGESQKFWMDLLSSVFGIENFAEFIFFEEQVKERLQDKTITNFIDAYIPSTRVMIEQKSSDKDLRKPIKQSDGRYLTPYQQAKKYVADLPLSQHPKWIVSCNFTEFLIYDMEHPSGEPEQILLKNLGKEYHRLNFLVDARSENIKREVEVSIKAGEIVGKIYDALLPEFGKNPTAADLHALNVLCVRLVFCLYAEDAGIFKKEQFYSYLKSFRAENMRVALRELFRVLDTKPENRDRFMEEKLADFPYVNGSLFHEKEGETIPPISEKTAEIILTHGSLDFDWSEISPTIFGAVFESTLNPATRRSGGMHYTSIENIHKVIDPLFLNDLREELNRIVPSTTKALTKLQQQKLLNLQDKIASLKFLDPACGSGNFLTETYTSLRKLENQILMLLMADNIVLGEIVNPVKVNITQFYGIEINDFAVNVAKTALWIAESQMLKETEIIVRQDIEFLPLTTNATIVEGNALKMDWEYLQENNTEPTLWADKVNVVSPKDIDPKKMILAEPGKHYDAVTVVTEDLHIGKSAEQPHKKNHYDYLISNPPFVGYGLQTKEQKQETLDIFVDKKGKSYSSAGKIDYVANWYFKAAKLIQGTNTKCAFVSTNSITQGEQVAGIWKPLFDRFKLQIDFAYQTFRWDSESEQKAHVHCVIIGFSANNSSQQHPKRIYLANGKINEAKSINPYLMDAPNIFVESRKNPLCNVPLMTTGNRPADGGHLIIEANEYEDFISKEPDAKPFIKRLIGSEEFINNKPRYCLWLVDATPAQIKGMREVYKRVQACKLDRENSPDAGRQKLALRPALFRETNNPENYIIVPATSSEKRTYIPLGFLGKEFIPSNAAVIIPDATLYHFGILTSSVHMAWMRTVSGKLESRYRYSKDIVYNNFPWCNPTDVQKATIENTAQAILDVRAKYPDCSLADLYDDLTMPTDLRKAHSDNDKAVMEAYGFNTKMTEAEIIIELLKKYQELVEKTPKQK